MKRFDPEAINSRMLKNLQENSKVWKNIPQNGPLYEILMAESEGLAEVARYMEYMLAEKKWDTARNFSSIAHMSKVLGKKQNRKVSAKGFALISHTDQEGINRLQFLGKDYQDPETPSNYDNIIKNEFSSSLEEKALVPWVNDKLYSIPEGTVFTDSSGKKFTACDTVSIKKFTNGIDNIKKDKSLYDTFITNGSWNGYKYILVPIVQGLQKKVILGKSSGLASQTFNLNTLNIEAADSVQTNKFLYITVEDDIDSNGNLIKWKETEYISNSDSESRYFEIRISDLRDFTTIIFGDGYNGKIPAEGKIITLNYLESLGTEGDSLKKYSLLDQFTLPEGMEVIEDPRNGKTDFLHVTNISYIANSKNLETKEEFKSSCEKTFTKKSETLFDLEDIEENIYKITSIPLFLLNVSKLNDTYRYKEINGYNISYSPIIINALSLAGEDLSSLEKYSLLDSIESYINNDKKVYNLIFEIEDYQKFLIDTNIEIELIQNSNLFHEKQKFIDDLNNLIISNFGISGINPGNNLISTSKIDKVLLDNYQKDILSIDQTFWLRSFKDCIKVFYKSGQEYKEINERSTSETISSQDLKDLISNEIFDNIRIVFKNTTGYSNIANNEFNGSFIKNKASGYNIPFIWNIIPPDIDKISQPLSFCLVDETENGLSSLSKEFSSKDSYYGFSINIDGKDIEFKQLPSTGAQLCKLVQLNKIINSINKSEFDGFSLDTGLEYFINTDSETYIAPYIAIGAIDEDNKDAVYSCIDFNQAIFQKAFNDLIVLQESAGEESKIPLSSVYNAIYENIKEFNYYFSVPMIDKTLISTDTSSLMYINSSTISIVK